MFAHLSPDSAAPSLAAYAACILLPASPYLAAGPSVWFAAPTIKRWGVVGGCNGHASASNAIKASGRALVTT